MGVNIHFDIHPNPARYFWICVYCGSKQRAWIKSEKGAGGESGLRVGVRRGLVEASWIILQPEDSPPHPLQSPGQWGLNSSCSSTPKNGRTTKTLFLLGPRGCGWGGEEGGKERGGAGGVGEAGGGRGSIIKLIPSQFPLGAKWDMRQTCLMKRCSHLRAER